jgi:hypothetical protein
LFVAIAKKEQEVMRLSVRLGNALFLIALLSNYIVPGTLQRVLADDPPTQIPNTPPPIEDGPLLGDFIADTMNTMHTTLFGAALPGEQTTFYYTDEAIESAGLYSGSNNIEDSFSLNVIRFHQYSEEDLDNSEGNGRLLLPPDTQIGVIWATASTANGSINFLGFSVSSTNSTNEPITGFVPFVLHDVIVDYYVANDPNTPEDDFHFEMLGEDWDPHANGLSLNAQEGGPELCGLFECPEGQMLWCPGNDPAVIEARDNLADCTIAAMLAAAAMLVNAAQMLVGRTLLCLAHAVPLLMAVCLASVLAAVTAAVAFAVRAYAIMLAICWAEYWAAFQAAKNEACYANN